MYLVFWKKDTEFFTTVFVIYKINAKYAYQHVLSYFSDMAKQNMIHAIADYSATISRSVQSNEVLNMGPIAANQLRKAGCLEVVGRPVHHLGWHPMDLFENDMLQFVRRSRLPLSFVHSVIEHGHLCTEVYARRHPQRKKSTGLRSVERGAHSTSVFRLTSRSGKCSFSQASDPAAVWDQLRLSGMYSLTFLRRSSQNGTFQISRTSQIPCYK